uniref:Bromo domain-containing protein n=1 Tax=Panagrellus redivivus TaxID=6233 RepID=A0A7E4V6G5_PANRE
MRAECALIFPYLPSFFCGPIVSKGILRFFSKYALDNGKYECLRAFFNDVWLIFENARHYNTDESDVHITTFEMLKHLGPLANKMLTSAGYCCGEHRTYPPSIILCHSAKGCAIKAREYYWFYDEPCFHPVTGKPIMPRRYRFCDTCYTHAAKSGDKLIAGSDLAVPFGSSPIELDPKKFVMINNVQGARSLHVPGQTGLAACSCFTAKKMQSHWMSCTIKLKDCIGCRLYCGRVMLHHLSECQSDECIVPDCRRRRQGYPTSRLVELESVHFEPRGVSYEAVRRKCMDCSRSYSGTRNLMPPPLRHQPHRAVKRVMSDGDAYQSPVGRKAPQRVMSLPSNVVLEGSSRPLLMLDAMQGPSRQVPNVSNAYAGQCSTPPTTSNWSDSPGPSSRIRGYYQSVGMPLSDLPPNIRIVKRTRPNDEFEHYPPQYVQNGYMPHTPRPQHYHLQPSPLTRSADMGPQLRSIPRGRMTMRPQTPQSAQFMLRPILPDTPKPRYYLRQHPVRQNGQDTPLPYPLSMNHAPYQVIQPPPAKRRRTNASGPYAYEMVKTPSSNHLQYVAKPAPNGYHRPQPRRTPSPMQDPPVLEPYSADTDMVDSGNKSVKSNI